MTATSRWAVSREGPPPAAAASGTSSAAGAHSPPPNARKLKDPAKLGGRHRATVHVQEHPPRLSLEQYMRLDAAQYSELDPDLIQPLGGSAFLLRVPRITLFGAWLEPEVVVEVWQGEAPARVVILATSCRLSGSEVVQAMRLDSRFNLHFQLELTWCTAFDDDLAQQQQPPQRDAAPGGTIPAATTPAAAVPTAAALTAATAPRGQIHGDLQLAVWSEVIPPFHLMPRQALEAGGNAVLSGMMATLHPVFLRRLADDYSHWARDEGYRRRRAVRAAAADAPLQG